MERSQALKLLQQLKGKDLRKLADDYELVRATSLKKDLTR